MQEKELVQRIIDFAFIIKAQLQSKDTEMLRSILTILIMEAEDVFEDLESRMEEVQKPDAGQLWG